ncbi:protein-L-isoaspartate O-methyltransferase [Hypoxylon sp. EC38]|nr:protein-L-isoaspartate O-methyltransferase [Hypoxylon sp. EC38]
MYRTAIPISRISAFIAHLKPSSTYIRKPPHLHPHPVSHSYKPLMTMAWRSSGTSNEELVENLWRNKLITDPVVKSAFLKVDRAHYAPSFPYEDSPQPIGHNATISAPHMHANAVETLLPFLLPKVDSSDSEDESQNTKKKIIIGQPGRPRRVLDIGSGSGYLTHVLAELVGETGVVVGLEHIPELKELGERNMAKSKEGRELLASGRVRFRVGDGRKGWVEPSPTEAQPGVGGPADADAGAPTKQREEEGGWDAIHVGAAAEELHEELVQQLRSPGRMFIPVESMRKLWEQYIWTVDKDEKGNVKKEKLYGVRYVPLTDAPQRR